MGQFTKRSNAVIGKNSTDFLEDTFKNTKDNTNSKFTVGNRINEYQGENNDEKVESISSHNEP